MQGPAAGQVRPTLRLSLSKRLSGFPRSGGASPPACLPACLSININIYTLSQYLSQYLSNSQYLSQYLSDMGASVIKIEGPVRPPACLFQPSADCVSASLASLRTVNLVPAATSRGIRLLFGARCSLLRPDFKLY